MNFTCIWEKYQIADCSLVCRLMNDVPHKNTNFYFGTISEKWGKALISEQSYLKTSVNNLVQVTIKVQFLK